jgi:hypothetical protein
MLQSPSAIQTRCSSGKMPLLFQNGALQKTASALIGTASGQAGLEVTGAKDSVTKISRVKWWAQSQSRHFRGTSLNATSRGTQNINTSTPDSETIGSKSTKHVAHGNLVRTTHHLSCSTSCSELMAFSCQPELIEALKLQVSLSHDLYKSTSLAPTLFIISSPKFSITTS